jgi:hypothetical protein
LIGENASIAGKQLQQLLNQFRTTILEDSDQADEPDGPFPPYDQLDETSLANAVIWAQSQPFTVALYLYDLGEGVR